MNYRIDDVEKIMCQYANRVPGNGMHLGYMEKAANLWKLYLKALDYMNGERTDESERELYMISKKMKDIFNGTGRQYDSEIDMDI